MMKVAGVTFEGRQTTLAMLASMNRQIITVDLVYTTFNEEFAIKLVENSTQREIGWIHRSELYRFTNCNISQMTGFIGCYNDIYFVKLDWQQAPSAKQWSYVCDYCRRNGYGYPAFDVRAFGFVNAYDKEV